MTELRRAEKFNTFAKCGYCFNPRNFGDLVDTTMPDNMPRRYVCTHCAERRLFDAYVTLIAKEKLS